MEGIINQGIDPALRSVVFAAVFGVAMIIIARRLKISAIATLLIAGVVLGPEFFGLIQPETLQGGLETIVSLGIAVILFEGGLSLDIKGYRQTSRTIKRLLSLGAAVTWLTTALLIWLLFSFSPFLSLLAGSLVMVTGPTVINPLLRRIRANKNIHSILHWESVLIDPIGVFVAVFCFELVYQTSPASALTNFGLRLLTGTAVGTGVGLAAYVLIKRAFIPEEHVTIFSLATALFTYGTSVWIIPESGLLGVVVAGFVLGIMQPEELEKIKKFKLDLTEILIGMLFILLSANLNLREFLNLGLKGVFLVAAVILLIRPLAVFLSARGSGLTRKEKLFLSWVAPRGIVAASLASLFTLRLTQAHMPESAFLEVFTFSVVAVTVIIQGSTAKRVATILQVRSPKQTGWLIVGAHSLAEQFCAFLQQKAGLYSIIIDTNLRNIYDAQSHGFTAKQANALDAELFDDEELVGVGNLLALTDNEELNALICQQWSGILKNKHCYRWSPRASEELARKKPFGVPVWLHLPKPSAVSDEITRGETTIFTTHAGNGEMMAAGMILAYHDHKKVALDANALPNDANEGVFLVMQRRMPNR